MPPILHNRSVNLTTALAKSLKPASQWEPPEPEHIRQVLEATGMTDREIGEYVGLKPSATDRGNRTVRKWKAGKAPIPYAVWALVAYKAGHGVIWDCLSPQDGLLEDGQPSR
jgi:hypothetical protein